MTNQALSEGEFAEFARECLTLCQELLRQDTTNPPGNEIRAAEPLVEYLNAQGIATELVESSPGRTSVLARLSGRNRQAHPGLLLSHLDTSPVQLDHWTFDPFVGDVADGQIRGRGAVDLKSLVAAHAVGLAWLKRRGLEPPHDLVLLSVADETRGGSAGIRWLEEHRPEWLDAQWVLGEGSFSYVELLGSSGPVFTYCPHEKTALWLELTATGPGGHSSIPRSGTAVERLVNALAKIRNASQFGAGPAAEEFIARMQPLVGLPSRDAMIEHLKGSPPFYAMLMDTVNPTIIRAGMEPSVVPATASATVDCRLRPETDPDEFVQRIRDLIDDPEVEITERFRAVSGTSAIDGPIVQRLRAAVEAVDPGASLLPIVSAGYTDLRSFRSRGIPAYGCHVVPLTLADRARISGHDEQIPVEGLVVGARVIHEFLAGLSQ